MHGQRPQVIAMVMVITMAKAIQSGRGHQDDGQKFGQILAIVLAIDGHF